jgi:tetratricopeptide (TPR) repeat protein
MAKSGFQLKTDELFGGRYRILHELDRDEMGLLYKAEDIELGIVVALKVVDPQFTIHAPLVEQLKRAILLAREITHENVVRIHDFGDVGGIKFISMAYIEGQSLEESIQKSGRLDVERSLNIGRQICSGVSAAHRKGILHLNLHSRHIMVDENDRAYITVFGLVKLPERGGEIDQGSDIYALGGLMYEMTTGEQLPAADTPPLDIEKRLLKGIPPFLKKIVLKCLNKNPRKRYRSVTEILPELEGEKERPPKFVKYSAALALILLAAWGIYLIKENRHAASAGYGDFRRLSVAVMDFQNLTGDHRFDEWQGQFPHLLSHNLEQSKYFRAMPQPGHQPIKKDVETPEVDFILSGRFVRGGDTFYVQVHIMDAVCRHTICRVEEEMREVGDLYEIGDRLTLRIKHKLDFFRQLILTGFDRERGKITTSSEKAVRHYWFGMAYYYEGKLAPSIGELKRAIEIDPGFALAYFRLALNYSYIENRKEAQKYLKKALALKDCVPARESYLIQGFSASFAENDLKKAAEAYGRLLEINPEDEEGYILLGAMHRNLEEWEPAHECFSRVLEINPDGQVAYENLINIYMKMGLYDQALGLVNGSEEKFGQSTLMAFSRSRIYLCQGKRDLALKEAKAAVSMDPENSGYWLNLGNVQQAGGDLMAAEEMYRKLTEKEDPTAVLDGYYWLACLYLEQGKFEESRAAILRGLDHSREFKLKEWEVKLELRLARLNLQTERPKEALEAAQRAAQLIEEIDFLFLKSPCLLCLGLTYLNLDKIETAEEVALQIEELPESFFGSRHTREADFLKGKIAHQRGEYQEAADLMNRAIASLPYEADHFDVHALYLDALASVYDDSGQVSRYINTLKGLTSLTFGRLKYGDIYVKGFYRLGRCYQQKNWTGMAIDHYKKFVERWRAADHGLAPLTDAKTQMAILNDSSS